MTPCRFVDILGQQTQIVVTPNSSRVKTGPQHKSELIKDTDTKLIGDFDVIHCSQFSAAFPLDLIPLHDQRLLDDSV
jgi:CRISPR/Cas system CMR-associated protein Cmr1 (group 7 of RAMP superfamily)